MAHPKGLLIERLKELGLAKPEFRTESTGPAHEPVFVSDVYVDSVYYGRGRAGTKRDAERLAAEEALDRLDDAPVADDDEPETAPSTPEAEPSAPEAEPSAPEVEASTPVEGPFEGPWPIFEEVLAASLSVANARVDAKLKGEAAFDEVKAFALRLYKETLENLGEIVEEEI